MKLQEIKDLWEQDCQIDHMLLSTELLNIPKLHSKYYNMYSDENRSFKLKELEYARMRKIKREYYMGRLPRKFIESQGWEPIDHEIGLSEVSDYLKGDSDLCMVEGSIAMHKIKVGFLHSIIESLKIRGYNIRTAVEYIKFKAGES